MNDELTHKFVAVLNKKIPTGNLMNGLGHMAAGLAGSYPNLPEMRFDSYFDKDGGEHKSISDNPFIILQADNSNQIRNLRNEAKVAGIHFVDFTSTMTVGTYKEQQERTKNTPEVELEYYGICLFGPKEILNSLTKKFSLWRG
ncbi:MAG: hypothetical protein G01um10147_1181 [Microgenomates group bacterium Gr01-1014_7]|nr:MAG: hypothetical protein G01um10147_1181 [Microgenomates group bacterium Gr01-1014_7]